MGVSERMSNETKAQHFRNSFSGTLGTALEFYDFAIYGLAAGTVFKHVFYADASPAVALIASLATYSVGYFARPLGGIVLGALGDKIGRKNIMVWTIVIMGLASSAIGLLPTYEKIGIVAPVLLLLLRVTQGVGAGAEMSSTSTLLVESAPINKRGLVGSLVGVGTNGGTLIASLVWLPVATLPHDQFLSWGWRIPFLVSIVIALVGLWMRSGVTESPTFEAVKEDASRKSMIQIYAGLLRKSTGKMLACIGMRWGENGISTIFLVFFVGQIIDIAPNHPGLGSMAVMVSAAVGLGTVPLAGWLSDKFGRRRVHLALSCSQFIFALPAVWMIQTGTTIWVLIAFILEYSIGVMSMYAVQSAYMVELFGSRSRLAAVTASKELGALSSGGVAPLICGVLVAATGSMIAVGLYVLVLAAVSVVSTYVLPETRGRNLLHGEDAKKQ